jgi:hypothetical protein
MRYDVCTFYNAEIFDRKNPNFEVKGTNEAIERLFKLHPVPVTNSGGHVIGFVQEVGEWRGTKLHGDIVFWNIEDTDLDFSNYGVVLDDKYEHLISIDYITYE